MLNARKKIYGCRQPLMKRLRWMSSLFLVYLRNTMHSANTHLLTPSSQGIKLELGDFVVKLGYVYQGQSQFPRGLMVEAEYMPCCNPSHCQQLLGEFMKLLDADSKTTCFYAAAEKGPPHEYTMQHTVHQYVRLIKHILFVEKK